MTSAEQHAKILHMVARHAVNESRTARQKAHGSSNEDDVRAAYRACVLAARTLRRASMEHPDEEMAMIEESILQDELGYGLLARLARIEEPGPSLDPPPIVDMR